MYLFIVDNFDDKFCLSNEELEVDVGVREVFIFCVEWEKVDVKIVLLFVCVIVLVDCLGIYFFIVVGWVCVEVDNW